VSGADKPAIVATIGVCSGIGVVGVGLVGAGVLLGAIRAVIGVVSAVCVVVGVGALVDVIELVFGSVVGVGRLGVVTNGIVLGNPVIKTSFSNGIELGNAVIKGSFSNGIEVGNPVIKVSKTLLIVVVVGS
jgi:hypothetical protein